MTKPKNSLFVNGLIVRFNRQPRPQTKTFVSDKAIAILKTLDICLAMTTLAIQNVLGCSRYKTKAILDRMHKAGMIRSADVVTDGNVFKLWLVKDIKDLTPKNACKLALYSLFYSKVIKELPNVKWQIKQIKTKNYTACFTHDDKEDKEVIYYVFALRERDDIKETDVYGGTGQTIKKIYIINDDKLIFKKSTTTERYIYDSSLVNREPINSQTFVNIK